ncbi:MAG: hypothetical protein M1828_001852 [Chrysothrix sp. TS-e1954]|nr:MAG: hypothetical protein M1828_001852 [Chrysothrix sp. TS-e1954]
MSAQQDKDADPTSHPETDYKTDTKSDVPVTADEPIDEAVDEEKMNSDAQLQKDDDEAIDKSNIVGSRTRQAAPSGGYREPGDEEGIPTDDGTSSN